jgi:hypothetical protein
VSDEAVSKHPGGKQFATELTFSGKENSVSDVSANESCSIVSTAELASKKTVAKK